MHQFSCLRYMVYRKHSYCQKNWCFIGWKLNLKVSNSSFFKLFLEPTFFCLHFQKTVKSNRRQLGRPFLVARKGDIDSPSGQSPIGLSCFLEIQTEKITHGRCLIQEFWIKKSALPHIIIIHKILINIFGGKFDKKKFL